MAERGLSAMSRRVLAELTSGQRAVAEGTSLARIQRVLGCDETVAVVVVAELEAAGYIRDSGGGKRIPIRPTAKDADTSRFTQAIESVAADAVQADRLLREQQAKVQSTGRGPAASLSTVDGGDWVAAHGTRALAMLSIARERGWYELVCSFAGALGSLLRAARQSENARDAIAIGIDAENRLRQIRLADLWILQAGVLSDLGQHAEAERSATVAVVRALEAADDRLVTLAYSCRGEIRERVGRSGEAVEDYERAAAGSASGWPRGDPSEPKVGPSLAQARFDAAMTRLETAAGQLASHRDPFARTEILSLLGDALGSVAHADPLWVRMARAVRALQEMLPSLDAAEVVMTVARHAVSIGRADLAREYYEQAISRYRAAHYPHQADTARALLAALDVRDSPQRHAPSQ